MNDAFPTGKPHVSYSEVRCWKECPFRHKLSYIDKIDLGDMFLAVTAADKRKVKKIGITIKSSS